MKEILQQIFDSFYEHPLKELMPRDIPFVEVKGKANIVIGMRRVGKTSYCLNHIQTLCSKGLPKERILYINFDSIQLLDFTAHDFQTLLDVYYGMFPEHKTQLCYFVFDELQRIPHWELFIRTLLDSEYVRVLLTGSSSKLLSTEIGTELRGRGYTTEILPFSFNEFLRVHSTFTRPPQRFGDITIAKLRKARDLYFTIGGFPECQKLELSVRENVLRDYVDAVIFRDVVERYHVSNTLALRHLVKATLNTVGQKFSVTKFSATLSSMGIKSTRSELFAFLDYLTDAFLLFKVPVYSQSVRAQQVNPVKIYAIDIGLIRANALDPNANRGALLENLVYLHLRRMGYTIYYGSDAQGGEVDFIVTHRNGQHALIQVAYTLTQPKTAQREIAAFKKCSPELATMAKYLITYDDELVHDDIHVVPLWRFLLWQHLPTESKIS